MGRFDEILDRFLDFAERESRLRAAMVIGSQARADHPADEFSDLDLIMVVDDIDFFMEDSGWLAQLGEVKIGFHEPTFCGGWERRVLFDGAFDTDLILLTESMLAELLSSGLAGLLTRGVRVLVDRIGCTEKVERAAGTAQTPSVPSEKAFQNLVQDFWYHTVWAAKKLLRGELWTAKQCMDAYMKSRLLELLELYAHALHGAEFDTWHSGRFLEQWTQPWVNEQLRKSFAHFEVQDMKQALFETMALFSRAARETAERYGWVYPAAVERYAREWVGQALR